MKGFWQALFMLVCLTKLYQRWSLVYRFLFERRFKAYKVQPFESVTELSAFISQRKWVADGWRALGDSISYPGKLQWIADNQKDQTQGGDCDDQSIFIVLALMDMGARGQLKLESTPVLLSVTWMKSKYIPGGHNVAVWKDSRGWHWMSNWSGGHCYNFEPRTSGNIPHLVWDYLAAEIAHREKLELLGWMTTSDKLELLDWSVPFDR